MHLYVGLRIVFVKCHGQMLMNKCYRAIHYSCTPVMKLNITKGSRQFCDSAYAIHINENELNALPMVIADGQLHAEIQGSLH